YYSKFLPYDSDESDAFGATISCSENEVLVGAYSDDDNGFFSGAAYLFKKEKLLLSNHSVYKKSKINAFPTVFKDILYITNPDNYIYNIEIFDLSGKIVIEKKQIYASKYNLNCDNLNKGIYFLKVKGNKSEKLFKIIKL
ncbi:MAG TPA: T9SS type A sorting domain-containing protein, partial [Bacteroidetes bacterium]|nr:T9SS type A sorting domain-containing protein [Bacteroidota bacterium]